MMAGPAASAAAIRQIAIPCMLFRRRKIPPDLRHALRAAERAEASARGRGRWRRRLAMVLPGALVPSLVIVIGYLMVWHEGEVPSAAPPAAVQAGAHPAPPAPVATRAVTPAAMPRVIYGNAPPPPVEEARVAGRFTARVAAIDGDTLAAGGERLRLNGIDAPEMGQPCERAGRVYDCGAEARAAMVRILGSGSVTCESIGMDQYRRRVVRCDGPDGRDIAASLVAQGWAMAYRRFSVDYVPQEEMARSQGLGLWAGRFEPPWDWRHRR